MLSKGHLKVKSASHAAHGWNLCDPRNNFAQFKSCRSQAAATFYNKAWRADGRESTVETDSK